MGVAESSLSWCRILDCLRVEFSLFLKKSIEYTLFSASLVHMEWVCGWVSLSGAVLFCGGQEPVQREGAPLKPLAVGWRGFLARVWFLNECKTAPELTGRWADALIATENGLLNKAGL